MFRIAIKSVLAKKMRLFSTALSVLLGVAFLSGTLIFTDTIGRTFDDLFANVYESTDSVVRSTSTIDLMQGEQRERISERLVDDVAAIPGVETAAGIVQGYAQVVGTDGAAIGDPGRGAPTFGMSNVPATLSPWTFTEGSRAPTAGEIAIDVHTAELGHLRVGDTITVLTQTGPHRLPLVGTVRFGTVDSPGGASVSLFDLPTAQQVLLGKTGQIDMIMVHASPGANEAELTASIAAVLPQGTEALTGAELIAETQDAVSKSVGFFTTFLLVFAVIGVIVACFTIYNTFQIVVSQRLREMSLMRSIGATQRQVMVAQLFEAIFIGVLASIGGLIAGLGMAAGLKYMLQRFGIDVPASELSFRARTVVIGLVIGVAVTVVSALLPSLRASRTPPLGTAHELGIEQPRQIHRRLVLGGTITGLAIAAFVVGLSGGKLLLVGLGALLVFIGVFILGPAIARPAARVLGAPIAHAGVAGAIASQNASRNPKRTARTGGALMIGVALVAGVSIITASTKDWMRDILGDNFTGDFVVSTSTQGFGGLSPNLALQLAALPEVDAAAGVRVGAARDLDGGSLMYKAVDGAAAARTFDFGMIAGSVESLDVNGVLLDDDEAATRALTVGGTLQLDFLDGQRRTLTVRGIYTDEELAGPLVVSNALHEQTGVDQYDIAVFVRIADGVTDSEAVAALGGVSDRYPNGTLESRSEYIASQAAMMDPVINLMYGLLGLAIVIALLSIGNSIALSIHERSQELGLLRAVGMTRSQMRHAVGYESGVIATIGTLLGLVIGVFFGWSVSVVIRDAGLGAVTLPIVTLVVIAVIAIIGGLLAAAKPAWHASRLDVLKAIATQ
jgi:putative ABC transport system permease protein